MSKYADFQDKPINKTLSYIHWFFISNIYFALCNILLMLSLYLFDIKFENIAIFSNFISNKYKESINSILHNAK